MTILTILLMLNNLCVILACAIDRRITYTSVNTCLIVQKLLRYWLRATIILATIWFSAKLIEYLH